MSLEWGFLSPLVTSCPILQPSLITELTPPSSSQYYIRVHRTNKQTGTWSASYSIFIAHFVITSLLIETQTFYYCFFLPQLYLDYSVRSLFSMYMSGRLGTGLHLWHTHTHTHTQSPSSTIYSVRISWTESVEGNRLVFGDHWVHDPALPAAHYWWT